MSLNSQRLKNALARLVSGLPARGPVVSPEVPNDLFQAHRSFYAFAARFAADREVLDLGCGTGYGTADLVEAGARRAVGIDPEARSIRYAKRRFRSPSLTFHQAAAERLPAQLGTFDRIVLGNVLTHLVDPEGALSAAAAHLAFDLPDSEIGDGLLIASVPPILDGQTLAKHRALGNPTARFLWDWVEALSCHFPHLRLFRCLPPEGVHPDFSDPAPSLLAASDFRFEEIPLANLDDVGGLAAVFVGSRSAPP
ncbi:MAG: class I SAM-dependent methyltransferase [Acidobacteriota bacterium]